MAVAAIGAVFAGAGVAFAGVSVATMAMVGTAITVVGAVTKNKDLMSLGAGFGVGALAGGAYNAFASSAADGAANAAAEGAASEAAQEAAQEGAKKGLVGSQMADVSKAGGRGFGGVEPPVGLGQRAPAEALKMAATEGTAGEAGKSVVPKGFWNNLTPAQGEVIGGTIKGVGAGAGEYLSSQDEYKKKVALINDQRRFSSQIPTITRNRLTSMRGIV